MTSAWIGDIDGFSEFQKQFHELIRKKQPEKESLTQAFSRVIENPNIPTIADFQVSTITETGPYGDRFFRYFEKFTLTLGRSQTITLKPHENSSSNENHSIANSHIINWGSAADGSYGVCYFVSVTPVINAIAYYFAHGNFGVLFCPKLSFEGIVIRNMDNIKFLEFIKSKYNIPLRGFMLRDNSAVQLIDMRFPAKT
ncbi:MAG: hypothetical protein IPQ03_08485 [Bacteroidetes bacterium]|nr:hypothetical protein [Bacteroidota bacterium]